MHDCPQDDCERGFHRLPKLRDHLQDDHNLTMKQAKRAVFGMIGE